MKKMITDDQINEKAKKKSIEYVTDFSPTSYRAGFVDGAKWIIEMIKNEKILRDMNERYEKNRAYMEERLKNHSDFIDVMKDALSSFFEHHTNEIIENDEMEGLILTAMKELVLEHKIIEVDDDVNGYTVFTHPNNHIWGGKKHEK